MQNFSEKRVKRRCQWKFLRFLNFKICFKSLNFLSMGCQWCGYKFPTINGCSSLQKPGSKVVGRPAAKARSAQVLAMVLSNQWAYRQYSRNTYNLLRYKLLYGFNLFINMLTPIKKTGWWVYLHSVLNWHNRLDVSLLCGYSQARMDAH